LTDKNEFEVIFFKKDDNTIPVKEFLDVLDIKMRAKAVGMIIRLEKYGNELTEPYSKVLDDGICELRIKQGSNISRILYFFRVGKKIILTNGFVKKTQKTLKKEIELAKKYRKIYLEREDLL